jgi:hypothetical protein
MCDLQPLVLANAHPDNPSLRRIGLILLIGSVAICGYGCAGRKESQAVARATLGQAVEYQQAVDAKIAGETDFYTSEEDILTSSAANTFYISDLNVEVTNVSSFAAQVERDKGKTQAPELADFATKLIMAVRSNEIAAKDYETHLKSISSSELQSLDVQKAKLTALRHDLEQLQAGPSTQKQLQSWIDFGTAVQKKMASTASQRKGTATSPPAGSKVRTNNTQ